MTSRELAIARSVMYAALFDYPLTLGQLHETLVESDESPSEILAIYAASPRLRRIVAYRDGFFFPLGRDSLVAERRHREARSRAFLLRYRWVLRLLCGVPFTRMVALSGSVAHLNLERGGDLDLCIVTRGPHVWTVAVAVVLLTKVLRRRRVVCPNLVLSDARLALEQRDIFTANQVIHLKPLIGADVLDEFLAANSFVSRIYPNARGAAAQTIVGWRRSRALDFVKSVLETALELPSPLVEAACRRLYGWHLRRRSKSWQSPEQVRLGEDLLKLHTRSHRDVVLERFERAMEQACERANEEAAQPAAAI